MQGVPEKHSYHVHEMQQAFAQIKRCHVMGNVPCTRKLIALIVLYRKNNLECWFQQFVLKTANVPIREHSHIS